MRISIIAKRYGEAYYSFALSQMSKEECLNELKSLKWLLRQNMQFERFLRAPEVPFSDKFRLIDKVLSHHYSESLRNFMRYLITKGRIKFIIEVCDYIRLTYAHGEAADVVLRTTYPLELELIERIKKAISKKIGKDVNLYLELDPDILGGVQLVIGNQVYDASLRHRLEEMKKHLLKAQVGK